MNSNWVAWNTKWSAKLALNLASETTIKYF